MIRSPLSLLASAYMYHRVNKDMFGMPTGPAKLQSKSVYDGLRTEAEAIMFREPGRRGCLREMLAVHQLVKDDPRVLTTDLAAFQADFDGATRQIFTHLLGPGHPAIDYLVEVNRVHDVAHWSPEHLKRNNHIHEDTLKHTVRKAIAELLRIGDPSIRGVQRFTGPLGYGVSSTEV